MTANSSNAFFCVTDLKIVYCNNYQSSITMPWTRNEKNICVTYLETKLFKTVQAKFCSKFNFIIPRKAKFIVWYTNFKPQGQVKNLNKKVEKPRSGRRLTARCPDNVDAVRDSVRKNLKKSLRRLSQRTWSFTSTVGLSQSISTLVIWFDHHLLKFPGQSAQIL